jgi:hypothetical protein
MKQYGEARRGKRRSANQPREQRGSQRGGSRNGSSSSGVSITFHRPLNHYVNGLAACGLLIDALREITSHQTGATDPETRANAEIPLFLGLRAVKLG